MENEEQTEIKAVNEKKKISIEIKITLVCLLTFGIFVSFYLVITAPKIQECPYEIPENIMDKKAVRAVGYLFTPFESTGFEPRYAGIHYYEIDTVEVCGAQYIATAEYLWAGGDELAREIKMKLSSGLIENERLEFLRERFKSAFGRDPNINDKSYFIYYITGENGRSLEITVNVFDITIDVGIERNASDSSSVSDYLPGGLTRKLVDSRHWNGMRRDRQWDKYDYYDAAGDCIGSKTIYGDGYEVTWIADNHKDEYSSLP